MTWSYDPALPTDKDKVRFLIGDTDTANQMVQDETIDGMLTLIGDVYGAGAACCEAIASTFAKLPNIVVDGLSVAGTTRAALWRELAATIRGNAAFAAGALGIPFVSGTSLSEMTGTQNNSDRPPDKFGIGNMDFPGSLETANGPGPTSANVYPWPI